jgi:hypothetical protein
MRRKVWPTFWQQWIGVLAIKILPAHLDFKPEVVYITHVDRHGDLHGQILNSSTMLFASPWQLVPYSPRLYERLNAQFLLRKGRRIVEHQTQSLKR